MFVRSWHRHTSASFRLVASSIALVAAVLVVTAGEGVAQTRAATTVRTTGQRYDATVIAVIADLDEFWRRELRAVYGRRYRPVRLAAGVTRSSDPVDCAGERVTGRLVRGDTFYSPDCDLVAWDDEELFPSLSREYGDVVVALVLAHEWGHVVQARAGVRRPTIVMELQADCFAGAWVRDVRATPRRGRFTISDAEHDRALAGMLTFRDPVGTSPQQAGSHGSAFDRVSAFQDGYTNGVSRCRRYTDTPPAVVQRPFTDRVDAALGGNLPLAHLVNAVTPELNNWWSTLVGDFAPVSASVVDRAQTVTCERRTVSDLATRRFTQCAAESTVLLDEGFAVTIHRRLGDFATATMLARGWANLGLARARSGTRAGTARELQVDCLAGAWAGAVDRDPNPPSLSPGDLDEAVAAMLMIRVDGGGSGFDRVRAFRNGYLEGPSACGLATI